MATDDEWDAIRQTPEQVAYIAWLRTLTDEQRSTALAVLHDHFCQFCGNDHLPCYCTRDD